MLAPVNWLCAYDPLSDRCTYMMVGEGSELDTLRAPESAGHGLAGKPFGRVVALEDVPPEFTNQTMVYRTINDVRQHGYPLPNS
jgi:hypothetical protein